MRKVSAIVLAGDGINCEQETALACRSTDFDTRIVHVNDLVGAPTQLEEARLLVLPGGFSFGDELGSGKILALKLKYGLRDVLDRFISGGGAVLGICNGFQVLTRLGVFGPGVVLAQNEQGHFINKWVGLEITGKSIFTDGLKLTGVRRMELPARHGEGRLVFSQPERAARAWENGEIVLQYETDHNGAWNRAAALSSHGGRVLGLMPHPEAFWAEELHPWGSGRGVPLGIEMFRSARTALEKD